MVEGDEVLVEWPGTCIHGFYGFWTGASKPPVVMQRRHHDRAYEIVFFHDTDLPAVWLTSEQLRWL